MMKKAEKNRQTNNKKTKDFRKDHEFVLKIFPPF